VRSVEVKTLGVVDSVIWIHLIVMEWILFRPWLFVTIFKSEIRLGFFLSFQGVPCDLVTGEERLTVEPEGKQATHVSCTVEMCNVATPCMYLLFRKLGLGVSVWLSLSYRTLWWKVKNLGENGWLNTYPFPANLAVLVFLCLGWNRIPVL
jgi:hypothetical protein